MLIAACEHVARSADGARLEDAAGAAAPQRVLDELGLPREALADLLVIEDAWAGLLDALATRRH